MAKILSECLAESGVQINAADYSAGYSMMDVNQIYNEMRDDDNKMTTEYGM